MMLSGVLWKDNFFDIGAAYVKVIILIITKSPGRKFGSSATHTKPRAILRLRDSLVQQQSAPLICRLITVLLMYHFFRAEGLWQCFNNPWRNHYAKPPWLVPRRLSSVLCDHEAWRTLFRTPYCFLNQAFKFVNENTNILHSVLTSLFVCYVLISLHCFSLTDAFFICFLFT